MRHCFVYVTPHGLQHWHGREGRNESLRARSSRLCRPLHGLSLRAFYDLEEMCHRRCSWRTPSRSRKNETPLSWS